METWKEKCKKKIQAPDTIATFVKTLRQNGKTIVTLNGSFDLLHAGHLHILYEASKLADILIVAVNSDCSIQEYKSLKRPIITLSYRMEMLSALACIDYVTWFEESNPCAILDKIRPDVHVTGEEYRQKCVEAALVEKNGGKLYFVNRIPGLATSNIIEKIKVLSCD